MKSAVSDVSHQQIQDNTYLVNSFRFQADRTTRSTVNSLHESSIQNISETTVTSIVDCDKSEDSFGSDTLKSKDQSNSIDQRESEESDEDLQPVRKHTSNLKKNQSIKAVNSQSKENCNKISQEDSEESDEGYIRPLRNNHYKKLRESRQFRFPIKTDSSLHGSVKERSQINISNLGPPSRFRQNLESIRKSRLDMTSSEYFLRKYFSLQNRRLF